VAAFDVDGLANAIWHSHQQIGVLYVKARAIFSSENHNVSGPSAKRATPHGREPPPGYARAAIANGQRQSQ
jgi:hypothetical protein